MNITLTGNLGGGKTSVCKELEKMGFQIISAGSIFRDVANEKGITVNEMNILAKTDPSIDKLIDDRSIKLGKELDNVVFDSRLAWHFAPNSFKVFLLTDPSEAARRVYYGDSRSAEVYSSYEEAIDKLSERAMLERDRFKGLYNIDYFDRNNYNLIIESTNATPKEIADEIVRNFENYKANPFDLRIELNIKNLHKAENDFPLGDSSSKEDVCLCLEDDSVDLVYKNGFVYINDGYEVVENAWKNGKIFCETKGFSNIPEKDSVKPQYTISLFK